MVYGDTDVATCEAIVRQGYEIKNVFDIGASNSAWTSLVRAAFPAARFDMFEPLAEKIPGYKEGMRHYLEHDKRAFLHKVAVGEKDGEIVIHIADNLVGSTTLDVDPSSFASESVEVPVRSIDSIVASGLAPVPDMIKFDIQGGELAALKSARQTLPQVSFLLLETWLMRGYGANTPLLTELIDFLAEFRFVPYEIGDAFRDEGGQAFAQDVWFINARKSKIPHHYYPGIRDTPMGGIARALRNAARGLLGGGAQTATPAQPVAPDEDMPNQEPYAPASVADHAAPKYFERDAAICAEILKRGYAIKTVFDVGASNSAWTTTVSPSLPGAEFHLFEPLAEIQPSYREVLDKHLRTLPHAHLHALAIGKKDGATDILITKDPSASTTLAMESTYLLGKSRSVPMRAIDSLVAEGICPLPQLIKMDIQGGELAALQGAIKTLPNVTFLALETWLVRGYGINTPLLSEITHFLDRQGFVPYEFSDAYRFANGQAVAVDVWFINVRKALSPPWYYTSGSHSADAAGSSSQSWDMLSRIIRKFKP